MELATCFNVTLDSDDCKELFSDNKIANFKVRLPRKLHLNESWRVGLADVTFSNSRYTFDRPQHIEAQIGSGVVYHFWLSPTLYHLIEDLVADLNRVIKANLTYLYRSHPVVSVPKVLLKDGKISIIEGIIESPEGHQLISLKFSPTLINILGLDRWGIPFLNARQSLLFVYCDIVKQRVVGDTAVKLLRTIDPKKGKAFGDVISQSFRSIYFCQIDNNTIEEIEIQLLDDSGFEPVFKFGNFRCTLQFKQV